MRKRKPVEWTQVEPLLDGCTDFERSVYRATCTIPFGETRSYGWVARKAGVPRGARAAGRALHRNPLPYIVPCHRVIRADGGLGGFSRGVEVKKRLLELERELALMRKET